MDGKGESGPFLSFGSETMTWPHVDQEEERPALPLTADRAKAIIRNGGWSRDYLADHVAAPCSCNACIVCAVRFLAQ